VLEAAPRYKINHLELSHEIVMQVDQVMEIPGRARLIEEIAAAAATKGIKTYIWAHEINTRRKDLDLDPSSKDGRAFWQSRQEAYRGALRVCPSLAGVILMFGSSPTEVWHIKGTGREWKSLSMPARIRFVTQLVKQVVIGEFHKELFVRDFNHHPNELRWLMEALRDFPDITVISKPEPQDFQPFYPRSPAVGAYGNTPQILELDLNGEYWGQSLIPVSQVAYLRNILLFGRQKGIMGAVGRIDTSRNTALGTPSEMNLYAFLRLLEDSFTSEEQIYAEWIKERYRLPTGSMASCRLRQILQRTFPMAMKTYYTLGFWTWKNQSEVPPTVRNIEGGIIGKSTAIWDPDKKDLELQLLHPDRATVQKILIEKQAAVRLADTNLRELQQLRKSLAPKDYQDLHRRLTLACDLTRLYEAIASAYWRVKLAQTNPSTPEASPAQCKMTIRSLGTWANRLSQRYADLPFIAQQIPRLRSLTHDLQLFLISITGSASTGYSQRSLGETTAWPAYTPLLTAICGY